MINLKRIYMIAGKARHGKDTLASYIKTFYERKEKKCIILQISTPLKFYANKVLNWNFSEETKPRDFLQTLGVDVIRKGMGENFLINRLVDDIKVLFHFCDIIVVSDVRLPNEFLEIKNSFSNVKNIFVDRINFDNNLSNSEKSHITENALENFKNYDYIIKNDGTLDDLKTKIFKILEEEVE